MRGFHKSVRSEGLSATRSQMLALLRAALWQRHSEIFVPEGQDVDWDKIAVLSVQQTVAPMVLKAALDLPDGQQPPREWRLKACFFIERNRRTHLLVDGCVAEAVSCLKDAGIRSVLLKGQAYARIYPDPTLRQCGDIDLYVGPEHFYKAYLTMARSECQCDGEFDKDAKHYTCTLRGVSVELHRIAGKLRTEDADRYFRKWSRECLDSAEDVMEIDGEGVVVPPAQFSVIFVFMHLYQHFLIGGIGLRHVCDWMMLVHKYHREIDPDVLAGMLRRLGLLRGWRMFMSIAVRYLGMPEKESLLYNARLDAVSGRILTAILKEGNFGRTVLRQVKRPNGYFSGKIHSMRLMTRKMASKLWVDPSFITRFYCHYLIDGASRVIKERFG